MEALTVKIFHSKLFLSNNDEGRKMEQSMNKWLNTDQPNLDPSTVWSPSPNIITDAVISADRSVAQVFSERLYQ